MRPTARPILSWPVGPAPRAIWSASLVNAASVARSRSSRLRARSSANSGFLQTTTRAPGASGAVISARSRSSNSESWKAPLSTSARICGARSAVIQSSPAGASSARMRRAGDHPAVPDQHHPQQAEALLELVDLRGERRRVGGVAFEHLDRDRTPVGGTPQDVDDLQLAPPSLP